MIEKPTNGLIVALLKLTDEELKHGMKKHQFHELQICVTIGVVL